MDVITPLVDDAHLWGRIAATNAASDVHAMGGSPMFGLNIVGWHRDVLPLELLGQVIAGAQEVAAAEGWALVGGHSIDDHEPKFGVAVIGEAHPDRLLRNDALRPGDILVLTDPIGTGAVTTAIKAGTATATSADAAIEVMVRSNATAARVAAEAGLRAATDVTGFGLLGHLATMVELSGVDVTIDVDAVPLLPGAADLVAEGTVPGGTRRNLDWVRPRIVLAGDRGSSEDELLLLADAQTSGGLLLGVPADRAAELVAELRRAGHAQAAAIGEVGSGEGRIVVGGDGAVGAATAG